MLYEWDERKRLRGSQHRPHDLARDDSDHIDSEGNQA